MNANPQTAWLRLASWAGLGVGALFVLVWLVRLTAPENSLSGLAKDGESRPAEKASPRQAADAVYLRFLQDESTRPPAERLERAISGFAAKRGLSPAEAAALLEAYARDVENDPRRNSYERQVAATLRRDFTAASRFSGSVDAQPSSIIDPAERTLAEIHSHLAADDLPAAERSVAEARRLSSREREPEFWARVQAAAFKLALAQGNLDAADVLAREVLEIREKVLPPDSPGIAHACHNFGVALARNARHEESIPLFQRAVAVWEKAYGPEDLSVADATSELASALAEAARFDEAITALQGALRIYERSPGAAPLRQALALDRLGYVHLEREHPAEAEAPLRRAVAIYDKTPGARGKDHADAVHRLGLSMARQDRRKEALPHLRRSTVIAAGFFSESDPMLAVYHHNLAVWADAAGDDPLTVEACTAALRVFVRYRRAHGREAAAQAHTAEFYRAYLERSGLSPSEIARRLQEALQP
jgi:tetratricopeptide (TPR) repeat protein